MNECVPCAHGSQKKALDALELESWVLGTKRKLSSRAASTVNRAISPDHDERILTFRAQAGFPTDPKMSWSISDRGELVGFQSLVYHLLGMRTEGAVQTSQASFPTCKMRGPLLSGFV